MRTDLDDDEFYEADEPIDELLAAFDRGPKFRTARPSPDGRAGASSWQSRASAWKIAVADLALGLASLTGGVVALIAGRVSVAVAMILVLVTTAVLMAFLAFSITMRQGDQFIAWIDAAVARRRSEREHKA